MGTIWTPGGERPVRREGEDGAPGGPPPPRPGVEGAEGEPSPEEMEQMMAQMQAQLLETPAAVIARDHAATFHQLAVLHLSQDPPQFSEAAVAIDSMGALVNGLGQRMADNDKLEEALDQLRAAFVQLKAEHDKGDGSTPAGQDA